MLGIIFSAAIAVILWLFSAGINPFFLQIAQITFAISTFLLFAFTTVLAFGPLQRIEEKLTPRVIDLVHHDHQLQLIWLWVIIFVIGSLLFGIGLFNSIIFVMAWILGVGITFDLYRYYVMRHLGYLNPFQIVQLFAHRAKVAIQNDQETDLCNQIDALAEVGVKSLNRSSVSLSYEIIDQLQQTTRIFLTAEKSISHHQKVSFALFYIFQRLEMIYSRAIEMRLEPVISALVSSIGKIALYAAKFDISLVAFPFQLMGKFIFDAQKKGLSEVGVRGILIYLEVSKRILTETDVSYAELQDPYFTLIGQIEEISKEMFRQDKTISFKILNQPFLDLKEQFAQEKLVNHQDTPIIVKDINRVLDEFANLEAILKTVPPVSKIIEEVKS